MRSLELAETDGEINTVHVSETTIHNGRAVRRLESAKTDTKILANCILHQRYI